MTRLSQRLDPRKIGPEAEELKRGLERRIVGQEEAIQAVVDVYQAYLAGLNPPGRPLGNFLFLGPTGTGKTRVVEAVAETLLGDARAVLKIDCAEFQHGHEIARLVGSPPGYLGHRETRPMLSQEALHRYHTESVKISLVLFDEIEKASDALWNLLLGILDKGVLTLGDNQRVDFSRVVIFMTSNLGAGEMASMLRPAVGFSGGEIERARAAGHIDDDLEDRITHAGLEAARRRFTPEFLNRIDKAVVFRPLGDAELRRILELELDEFRGRLLHANDGAAFALAVSEAAKAYLLREGTDIKYGARHLKRTIDRALVHPISNLIATRQVRGGDWIHADFDPEYDEMVFFRDTEASGTPVAKEPDQVEPAALRLSAAAQAEAFPARVRSTRRSR